MEDLTIRRPPWENSLNTSNKSFNSSHYGHSSDPDFCYCHDYYYSKYNNCKNYYHLYGSPDAGQLIILIFGLLVTLVTMIAVSLQVKKDQAAPVFIINLLICDIVETCSAITWTVHPRNENISFTIHQIGLSASVLFMVCVSLERYLMIAKPLWYRFRRNIKTYVIICVMVWVLAVIVGLGLHFYCLTSFLILLPLPFFMFFLVGTIRALSAAISVPADEKRRIVAIQVLMLLVYVLLFLPSFIFLLLDIFRIDIIYSVLYDVYRTFLYVSPLADSIMYILMRKSVLDKVLASFCCKMSDNQQQINTMDNNRLGVETSSVPSVETL